MTDKEEKFDRFWKRATIVVFIVMGIAFLIVIYLYLTKEDKPLESEPGQQPALKKSSL